MVPTAAATRPVSLVASRLRSPALVSTTAAAGVCVWIAAAPFEGLQPVAHVPGQSISSVEAVLLAVFAAWFVAIVWTGALPEWRTPLTMPWTLFLVAVSAAALAAPSARTNALHMAGRFGLAFGVYLVTVSGITTFGRLRAVFVVSAAVGVIVSVLAVLEVLGMAPVLRALTAFRPGIAVVGAHVRAAGPFQYPTIASMYLEILFAFVLALVLLAMDAGRHVQAAAAAAAAAVMAEAITLTFTRAGLATMCGSLAIAGAWRWRRRGVDGGVKAIMAIAVVIVIEVLTSHPSDAVRLRMTTEAQDDWYRASIEAPLDLDFTAGGTIAIPVTLTNTGLTAWDSAAKPPYRVSYHWLLADQDRVANFEGLRTTFPEPVRPGATVTIRARVQAPGQPGQYRLMWDLVQEGRLWFSTEPGAEIVVSRAMVRGPAVARIGSTPLVSMPKVSVRPGRLKLWRAAGRMLLERPLLGVGPDNFRLLYGGYAGIANPDTRVHTNNMYLEVLVGGGLVAGAAFGWLCWRALSLFAGALRRAADGQTATVAAAVASAGAAIALHGIVDSFFSFTATYVLFAITLGLASASDAMTMRHANRV
jgi:hypothetical protein